MTMFSRRHAIAQAPAPMRPLLCARATVVLLVMAAVVLAGCAQAPPVKGPGNRAAWQARRQKLLKISHWSLRARVGSAGIFGWSGSVNWHQRGSFFDVLVSGPLGIGGMHIQGTPHAAIIRARGKTYTTDQPEVFLEKNLGVSLPVDGLRYWTLGVPVPGSPARVHVDQKGRVVRMHQNGWTLTYRDYIRACGYYLPRRLSAKRKNVHLKMVVEKWVDVG